MKFIETVSIPFDPILPTQPSARLYRGGKGKYYAEFNFGPELAPLPVNGKDQIEAELNLRTTLYIMRAVARGRGGYSPDFPPEYDRRLTEDTPAFIKELDARQSQPLG